MNYRYRLTRRSQGNLLDETTVFASESHEVVGNVLDELSNQLGETEVLAQIELWYEDRRIEDEEDEQ